MSPAPITQTVVCISLSDAAMVEKAGKAFDEMPDVILCLASLTPLNAILRKQTRLHVVGRKRERPAFISVWICPYPYHSMLDASSCRAYVLLVFLDMSTSTSTSTSRALQCRSTALLWYHLRAHSFTLCLSQHTAVKQKLEVIVCRALLLS